MSYYRAMHDFHAEEAPEVSVREGDVVIAVGQAIQNGWIKVVVTSVDSGEGSQTEGASHTEQDSHNGSTHGPSRTFFSRKGYVPVSYLKKITWPVPHSDDAATTSVTTPQRAIDNSITTSVSMRQSPHAPASHSAQDNLSFEVKPNTCTSQPCSSALNAHARTSSPTISHTPIQWRSAENLDNRVTTTRVTEESGRVNRVGECGGTATTAVLTSSSSSSPKAQLGAICEYANEGRPTRTECVCDAETGTTTRCTNSSGSCLAHHTVPASNTLNVFTATTSTEAFIDTEMQFRQLMQQRADILSSVSSTLVGARADVDACKKGCSELLDQLRSLNEVIGSERCRWVGTLQSARNRILRMSNETATATTDDG